MLNKGSLRYDRTPKHRIRARLDKAGLIESWGRGTVKIVNDCKKYGLKEPQYMVNNDHFFVIFYRNTNNQLTEKVTAGGLNDRILLIVKESPGIQLKEILKLIGDISQRTVERQISALIKTRWIERRGSRKAGGYFIFENK